MPNPAKIPSFCEHVTRSCIGHDAPKYHIVPRADVAKYVSEDHEKWLNTPGRKGQAHKDNSIRNFADLDEKYLDRWELLGLD
jgi:hypothetical protein